MKIHLFAFLPAMTVSSAALRLPDVALVRTYNGAFEKLGSFLFGQPEGARLGRLPPVNEPDVQAPAVLPGVELQNDLDRLGGREIDVDRRPVAGGVEGRRPLDPR